MTRASGQLVASVLMGSVLLTGCGSTDATPNASSSSTRTAGGAISPTPSPRPTQPARPTYKALGKPALLRALVDIQDLPPGYSQDPPEKDTSRTFCNYRPPFTEKIRVVRDFTKGGGFSSEFLSAGLRQYATAEQAKSAFKALSDALVTCRTETVDGTKYTYALTSTPEVGEDRLGVKITTTAGSGISNFVVVGPTLINVGGSGVTNVDADAVTGVVEKQVRAYTAAAGR